MNALQHTTQEEVFMEIVAQMELILLHVLLGRYNYFNIFQ